MNKKMRELLTKIQQKTAQARAFMDGENKDVTKATELLDEVDGLKAEFEAEKRLFEQEKEDHAPSEEEAEKATKDKVSGFKTIAKMLFKKPLTDAEKALIVGGTDGEDLLLPQDPLAQQEAVVLGDRKRVFLECPRHQRPV